MSRTGGGQHRPTPSPSEAPAQIQTTRFRLSDLPYTIISSHSHTHSPESRLASCTWYFIHRDQTTQVHPPPIDPLPSKRNLSPRA